MIIDTHTHFYDPTRPEGVPWPPPDNALLYRPVYPHLFKELATPAGVTGTVVVQASSWLEDNRWILDLAAADPFIVGFVGHIPPGPTFAKGLARFGADPLFRGIRCGGSYFEDIESGSFLAAMEMLAARNLQLDVLVRQEHLRAVVELALRLPTLPIVVNHIGHMPIDGNVVDPAWIETFHFLAAQANIFMKVSAVMEQSIVQPAPTDLAFYLPALDALWDAFGAERLIYGSNWPVCERAGSFAASLELVKSYFATKGEEATANYFWRNAKGVYRWVER